MDNVSLCSAAKRLRRVSVWAACKSQLLLAKQSFTFATYLLDSYKPDRKWCIFIGCSTCFTIVFESCWLNENFHPHRHLDANIHAPDMHLSHFSDAHCRQHNKYVSTRAAYPSSHLLSPSQDPFRGNIVIIQLVSDWPAHRVSWCASILPFFLYFVK